MTDRDSLRDTNREKPNEKVDRDPSARLVRDLATAPPAKELSTVKAAVDAAERDGAVEPARRSTRRSG